MQGSRHLADQDTARQIVVRKAHRRKFHDVEQTLASSGRPLQQSTAGMLDGPASDIYAKSDCSEGREKELT